MKSLPWLLAAALLVLVVSGCATPRKTSTDETPVVEDPRPPPLEFPTPTVIPDSCRVRCRAPSVATTPDGVLFVTPSTGDWIQRSFDAGRTFERLPAPPLPDPNLILEPYPPPPLDPNTLPGPLREPYEHLAIADAQLVADAAGRLFFLAVRHYGHGFQVAVSLDNATTWTLNSFLSPATDPAIPVVGAFHPTLAVTPNGTVHLAFDSLSYGPVVVSWTWPTPSQRVWSVVRSVDGWGRATLSGTIASDGRGLYLPYRFDSGVPARTLYAATTALPPRLWSTKSVFAATDPATLAGTPQLAIVGDKVALAFLVQEATGPPHVRLTGSSDRGQTWADAVRCDAGGPAYAAGLRLANLGGASALAWQVSQAGGSAVRVLRLPVGSALDCAQAEAIEVGRAQPPGPVGLAGLSGGRLVVAWENAGKIEVSVQSARGTEPSTGEGA